MSFRPGGTYLARCGETVRQIERQHGSRLIGTVYHGRIAMEWDADDGRQLPRGGTGPYDLVRPDRTA